ncbi:MULTISPECIES: metal-dependent transcriptional regulator [unclassified Arthrobacter]|uniref:metal-dependent transcriptional regulator n=1 Tax=unclassified Arthrobacter TaxID=235627 RepID=UPI00159D44A5|nr:metal-dependent transcriptional regulator [Arthrobacter sp. STN4]MCQ9162907.1 metal-dependent transcriptional regulator [Arthrobacter sp. STN4]NVM97442.1 metal-dependent transcriptional regulator [Arthrobacter sp. SDTb3-6]
MKATPTSSSIEDYVKVIYSFTEWQDKPITSTQLAVRLGVANSSVSEMVRKLKDQDLVEHEPYSPIRLTESGLALALSMVRRHRLLETYLVRELGYTWDEVHEEAERLEHAVSETFIGRMSAKLGNPTRDPHGDPIPDAGGHITMPPSHRLDELDAGHHGRVSRISDHDPELLRYLEQHGIGVDTELEVVGRRPFGGTLEVARLPSPNAPAGTDDAGRLDLGDEAAVSLWLVTVGTHPGCTVQEPAGGSLMGPHTADG